MATSARRRASYKIAKRNYNRALYFRRKIAATTDPSKRAHLASDWVRSVVYDLVKQGENRAWQLVEARLIDLVAELGGNPQLPPDYPK